MGGGAGGRAGRDVFVIIVIGIKNVINVSQLFANFK
jgi:hypothetical protein